MNEKNKQELAQQKMQKPQKSEEMELTDEQLEGVAGGGKLLNVTIAFATGVESGLNEYRTNKNKK